VGYFGVNTNVTLYYNALRMGNWTFIHFLISSWNGCLFYHILAWL